MDHQIGRVADIGQRPHHHRAHRNRCERRGERPHQGARVAAGELEERQVSGRVVEERGEQAGEPEIGGRARDAVIGGDGRQQPGESAVPAGVKHCEHRDDADEDASEQDRHLLDRVPGKIVGLAVLVRRQHQ